MGVQVQPDCTAYNVVLAALIDADQLEASLSLMHDMQDQGFQVEATSCDRLVMLLLMAGELQVACKVSRVCCRLTHCLPYSSPTLRLTSRCS